MKQNLVWFGSSSVAKLKFTLFWEKFQKMCYFCNTTPRNPYKIFNNVLFPDVVLSLTFIYILL